MSGSVVFDLLFLMAVGNLVNPRPTNVFRSSLSVQGRRNRSGKFRRAALLLPRNAPFTKIFLSMQEDAMISLLGLDYESFLDLHDIFKPLFDNYTLYTKSGYICKLKDKKKGRPHSVTSISCLALVLTWTRTKGAMRTLQLIFGLTSSPLSIWLKFGRRCLIKALFDHPAAKVQLPTEQEIRAFETTINNKFNLLHNVWGAMDGVKLLIEQTGHGDEQNNFYNGWTHDHYVTNLLLFSPDGKVRGCYVNAPGVLHDSTLATWGNLYDNIDRIFETFGSRVVVDSAFAKANKPSMIKSQRTNVTMDGFFMQPPTLNRQATGCRQFSEWGMRGLQGSFPRITERLHFELRGERKYIIMTMILLYNWRASTVGQNQIRTVYIPNLDVDVDEYLNKYLHNMSL